MAVTTSRRAIIDALLRRRELPERMGINESFWPFIRDNGWAEQGCPDEDFVTLFDLDIQCVGGFGVPGPRPDLAGVLEEDDETVVQRDAWGAVTRLWKHKAGTPEHIGFTVNAENWGAFAEGLRDIDFRAMARDARPRVESEVARQRSEDRFSTISFLFVFEKLRAVLGDVCMLESLMLEKDFIHSFNRLMTDAHLAYYDELLGGMQQRPDGVHFYEDLGYTRAPFASPGCHREMILPYHKELIDLFKGYDLPVIMHTCGDFRPHLPAIVEAGVDCIQALEAKTGMHVVDLARDWKDDLCFMGNLDVRVFESGDREAMRAEIAGKAAGMRELRAPYILMSDHSIPPTVAYDDYRFMLETCRAHANY